MKKLFEKHETVSCIFLIIVYLVLSFVCVQLFGEISLAGAIVNTCLSVALIALTLVLEKTEYYGLKKVENAGEYLYFIPLILIVTVNLWSGININNTGTQIILHVVTMINVGFIEEMIFRGFLFRMMAKSSVKSAVIVSSVTFGAGHIINLLNGADFLPTLMQICYATAIGYLFVVIFNKSSSLVPCIITHSLVNSLSVFNTENAVSLYVAPVFLTVVPIIYALYINKKCGIINKA